MMLLRRGLKRARYTADSSALDKLEIAKLLNGVYRQDGSSFGGARKACKRRPRCDFDKKI